MTKFFRTKEEATIYFQNLAKRDDITFYTMVSVVNGYEVTFITR